MRTRRAGEAQTSQPSNDPPLETFRHPRTYWLRVWAAPVWILGLLVAGSWLSSQRGGPILTLPIVLFFGAVLASITLPSRDVAATVSVSDQGMIATTYWWRKVDVRWEDVTRAERFLIRPIGRQVLALRLVTKNGRRLILSEDLSDFAKLASLIASAVGWIDDEPRFTPLDRLLYYPRWTGH